MAADEHEDDGVMYDADEEDMDTGGKETSNDHHHVDNLRFDELRLTVQITNATSDEEMYKAERQRQKLLGNAGDITPMTASTMEPSETYTATVTAPSTPSMCKERDYSLSKDKDSLTKSQASASQECQSQSLASASSKKTANNKSKLFEPATSPVPEDDHRDDYAKDNDKGPWLSQRRHDGPLGQGRDEQLRVPHVPQHAVEEQHANLGPDPDHCECKQAQKERQQLVHESGIKGKHSSTGLV